MRDSCLSEEAKTTFYCPFALPKQMHCLGDDCMGWENDYEAGGGLGDCSLLVHRRELVNGLGPMLNVGVCKAVL